MILFNSKSGRDSQFLSNFYMHDMVVDGRVYASVEHYFQAEKYRLAGHAQWADFVIASPTPRAAKMRGGPRMKRADKPQLSDEWLAKWNGGVRVVVMKRGLQAKFKDPELAARLADTKDQELVEDNKFDKFWANGRSGKGANMLGKLLMNLRATMKTV